jgi:cbb3-type cytochrome oxidase maturation protein
MEVIYLLLSVSFFIACLFLAAFFLAVKHGEFDDIKGASVRILESKSPSHTTQNTPSKSP